MEQTNKHCHSLPKRKSTRGPRSAGWLLVLLFGLNPAPNPLAVPEQNLRPVEALKKGQAAADKQDYHQAIYYFQKALEKNPRYVPARVALGWAYYQNQSYQLAEKIFRKVLNLGKAGEGKLLAGLAGQKNFLQSLKVSPDSQSALRGLALVRNEMGDSLTALKILRRAREKKPFDLDINLALARVYARTGQERAALGQLREILQIHPNHYEALVQTGSLHGRAGRDGEARRWFQKAIELKPRLPLAHMEQGYHYLRRQYRAINPEEQKRFLYLARQSLTRAYQAREKNFRTNYALALLYLGEGRFAEATDLLRQMSEQWPANPDIPRLKTAALLGQWEPGRETAALEREIIAAYRSILEEEPEDDLTRMAYQAWLIRFVNPQARRERLREARHNYDRARAAFAENRNRAGLENLRLSLALYPNLVTSRIRLLNYHWYQQNLEDYLANLELLRRVFPDEDRYLAALEWALQRQKEEPWYQAGLYRSSSGDFTYERPASRVFVFPFFHRGILTSLPQLGSLLAGRVNWMLNDGGAWRGYPGSFRRKVLANLSGGVGDRAGGLSRATFQYQFDPAWISQVLEQIPEARRPEYILYGQYESNGDQLRSRLNLYHIQSGVTVAKINLNTSGAGKLDRFLTRLRRRLEKNIPLTGKIVKKDSDYVYVNLGRRDGLKQGDWLDFYSRSRPGERIYRARIARSQTYISLVRRPRGETGRALLFHAPVKPGRPPGVSESLTGLP